MVPMGKDPRFFFMVSMVTNLIILCSIMYYFIVLSFQLVQTLMNILIYRSRSGYDFSPFSSITVSLLHSGICLDYFYGNYKLLDFIVYLV